MEYRLIKKPSKNTLQILFQRMKQDVIKDITNCDAVGLVQGRLIEMVYSTDIAEKAANVVVTDIKGSCPQNIIMIAIFGDTASVEAAMIEIKSKSNNSKVGDF